MAAQPSTPAAPRDAREMVARGREYLERQGVPSPRLESELLVAAALGLDRLKLFLNLDRPVSAGEVDQARALLVRRARGEPTAYLVGRREFYGRSFRVTPAVLVPRPETELLVDLAREAAGGKAGLSVLDVGTGSGCIAVTLALELDAPRVLATDVSAEALEVAHANAAALGAAVELELGEGLEPARARGPFELVVSNPPYVDPANPAALAGGVAAHEPALALFAPRGDPDHWVKRMCAAAPELLAPDGVLIVELGFDQGERALLAAREHGLAARLVNDLAGVPRALVARRPARG